MQRILFLWSMLTISLLFAGCSKKTIAIGEMNIDFTQIDLTDGNTGDTLSLDSEQSRELYEKLQETEFVQERPHRDSSSWDYWIAFRKDDEVKKEFGIHGRDTLEYDGDLYKAVNSGIDLTYVKSYLYTTFQATVIGTENGLLITPEKESMEARSSDKISVGLSGTKFYDAEGNEISEDSLMVGDRIMITYNGAINESYPAQISAYEIALLDRNVLIEAYLAVIEELYEEDTALNSDITMIAVDTTEWIHLSDEQKEMICNVIHDKYGFEVMENTYEELVEKGLILEKGLTFPNGILIKISNLKYKEEKQKLTGSMEKWRSGLGAIGSDFTAEYKEGEWRITKKNRWVS
ncbi:MAG TPA: hypothetical protein DEG06_07970 [Lachnospiraceae bacterium]|nr:hypothetical protein [Lachnospiraceae bacterium]HBY72164.1 hypothetical protein [Lachnospiraceae bacterium]HCA68976.1 hypothetical protein [Lachnospiraceae bacterium]HCM12787.1 hypothetical protein [Lachnospiraceae bacterium]HCR41497.1 hypothetical protein [Lachnospiraceae bacterium]